MKLVRTFHPIGQGAFYSERFENFTMVYDCGTDSNIEILKREINSTFIQKEEIDILFISHFHRDHINGLKYLLNRNKIKKIFFPLISEEDKIIYLLENDSRDPFEINVVINPQEALRIGRNEDTTTIGINDANEAIFSEGNAFGQVDIESINSKSIDSKILTSQKIMDWCYIPFNYRYNQRAEILRNLFIKAKLIYPDNNIHDVERFWNEHKTILKKIYKTIPGGHNENSMMLYSGPFMAKSKFVGKSFQLKNLNAAYLPGWYDHYIDPRVLPYFHQAGCLYFGDYNAKHSEWQTFFERFIQQWNNIATIQVPHHGSIYNYSPGVVLKSFINCVISSGKSNKYGHPHSFTIADIFLQNGRLFVVTEEKSSMYMQVNYEE